MPGEILFEEIQGGIKKSIRDFLKGLTAIVSAALLFNLIYHRFTVTVITVALFSAVLILILTMVLTNMQLTLQIKEDGIYLKFPPLQPSFNRYAWEDIQELYLREFDALKEYGGWGLRYNFQGRGYILGGNAGLQIVLRNQSRILISTRQPEAIATILKRMNKLT